MEQMIHLGAKKSTGIEQFHAITMLQPPSQTVKSPDGHLVIHASFDIQDLKMVELGGFEPPSISLFRTVLHV